VRGRVFSLLSAVAMLVACGDDSAAEGRRSEDLSRLARLLPSELDGKKLTRETFSGEVWLET
jgi:hypothetical protein